MIRMKFVVLWLRQGERRAKTPHLSRLSRAYADTGFALLFPSFGYDGIEEACIWR